MTNTLHVCITCMAGQELPEDGDRPGAYLHATLMEKGAPEGVSIVPVECMSACKTGCSMALSAPGKWTFVYGHMNAENADDILEGAAAYASYDDGLVPWRERPVIFRKQMIARIPPVKG